MNPMYFDETGKRRIPSEIRAYAADNFDVVVAEGFGEIVNKVGCIENGGRIASFWNIGKLAWYMKQQDGGSLEWKTGNVESEGKDVVFIFSMGLGNMSALPQSTGCFDLYINDIRLLSFRVVKHNDIWQGSCGSTFCYVPKRREAAMPGYSLVLDDVLKEVSFCSFGLGLLKIPARLLSGSNTARIKVVPVSAVPSELFFKLDSSSFNIEWADISDALSLITRGKPHGKSGEYHVYFGDIHNHSDICTPGSPACGMGSQEDNYSYARDVSNLDIYCLTDHDLLMDDDIWEKNKSLCDKYYSSDNFSTILGFEWTSSMYGHRNVYYLAGSYADRKDIPFYRSHTFHDYWENKVDSPDDLWEKLSKLNVEAITVPHHPAATFHPLAWEFYNEKFDRLAEIYSSWGDSEYPDNPYIGNGSARYADLYIREALNRGYRYGLIASSDGHDGHPGNAQSPYIKHHHIYHPMGSGWIGVLANRLDREEIFGGMKQRRCYGTTGVPIILDFIVNDSLMGSEIKLKSNMSRNIYVNATGCALISHIDIIKNGQVVYRDEPYEKSFRNEFIWVDMKPAVKNDHYYVRVVQTDGEMAWSSPVWIDEII